MRLQPVDLLADVCLGGEKGGFHVKTSLIERSAGVEKRLHLLCKAGTNGCRLARRVCLGAFRQRLDRTEVPEKQRTKCRPLVATSSLEAGQCRIECGENGSIKFGTRLLALGCFRGVEH